MIASLSPEKAGVGGSTPSLATIIISNLVLKNVNTVTYNVIELNAECV